VKLVEQCAGGSPKARSLPFCVRIFLDTGEKFGMEKLWSQLGDAIDPDAMYYELENVADIGGEEMKSGKRRGIFRSCAAARCHHLQREHCARKACNGCGA